MTLPFLYQDDADWPFTGRDSTRVGEILAENEASPIMVLENALFNYLVHIHGDEVSDYVHNVFDSYFEKEKKMRDSLPKNRLRKEGFNRIADRLVQLQLCIDDDPIEEQIRSESLDAMTEFILKYGNDYPVPQIGISPGGYILLSWRFTETNHSILVLDFIAKDKIQLATTSGLHCLEDKDFDATKKRFYSVDQLPEVLQRYFNASLSR